MIGPSNFILWIVIRTFAACCLFILVLLARVMLRRNTRSYATPSASPPSNAARLSLDHHAADGRRSRRGTVAAALVFRKCRSGRRLDDQVTGKMWSWTYEYPDYGNFSFDAPMLSNEYCRRPRELHPPGTDNHVVVPAGKTVRIVTIGAT
jgi:heme/copper-type cytochrome/quinol oxidase subunit 2